MAGAERRMMGSVWRGHIGALRQSGLLDEVQSRVGPETASAIKRPPLPIALVDSALFDDLLVTVQNLGGREAVAQMAYKSTHDSIGPVIGPVITAIVSMFGATPEAILTRLNSITSFIVKDAEFSFDKQSDHHGELQIRHASSAPEAWFIAWEGALRYMFDVTKRPGTIRLKGLVEDGRAAKFDVDW